MEETLSIPIPSPSTFDPFNQTLLWFGLDYTTTTITATEVEMLSLSTFWYQNMHLGLIYGAQLGLTSLMLTTLLLHTLPSKRRATIFLLNVAALVLDLVRSALMATWLTSMWNHPVVQFMHNYSRLHQGDFATSVAVNVVKTLELGVVLSSLLLQIRVILSTSTPLQRGLILSLAFILAMITLCIQLAATVVNSRNIVLLTTWVDFGLQERLADLSRVLQLVSTGFFLLVFVSKLGVAIRARVKLGQRQFGPMQMVLIGSLQSMLIPVIFTATQWSASGDFGSLSLTILAVQLPLTALWASTPFQPPHHHQQSQPLNQGKQNQQQRPLAMGPGFSRESEKNIVAGSVPGSSKRGKAVESIPMTTTVGSLDVDVKMDERDMV